MNPVTLHAKPLVAEGITQNPLPQLLQTPSGLALLELQGTINLPDQEEEYTDAQPANSQQTPIGRLVFADYDPKDPTSTAWTKRVYLYVGKHQRLTGEVKNLPKAIAVIRKRTDGSLPKKIGDGEEQQADELEVVEIVKHKIIFSLRPEPVGTWAMPSPPEQYHLKTPTAHVPNSPLPVLVYRSAFSLPATPASTCEAIEPNHWLKGGVFKHYAAHHFHSVTHECYAVFKGHSRLLLGRGPGEDGGVEVDVREGDAIVLPAGVAHCSLESSGDYEYVGLYPEGSPHWDNNFCKAGVEETREKEGNARALPVPDSDPVFGAGGPLVGIWREASGGF
ncbi:Uncharacterized protein LSUE1_G005262 [Lachnellula suecica]|uniref:Cupin type-1 domain-containing protein n=1 Tax=Lachnellula suecica TaxID=602035 RepID=A0A8T9CJD2_9HELO|nr:Uncharacterized protein LSUE1_G005262 [Lachnellula suecica]